MDPSKTQVAQTYQIMSYSHYAYNTAITAAILLVYGITLWAMIDPKIDTLTLTTVSRDLPEPTMFEKAYKEIWVDANTARSKIALGAELLMARYCVAPMVIDALRGDQAAATLDAKMISTYKNTYYTPLANVKFTTWDKRITAASYAKLSDENTPQFQQPWCKCAHAVLALYAVNTTRTMQQTNDAFKACIATQYHIATQGIANFNNPVQEDSISTRKSLSRMTFVVFLALAFAFNTLYSWLDFNPSQTYWTTRNNIIIGFLFAVALVMMFLPMAVKGAPWQNILAVSAFIVVPALILEFFVAEIPWSYIYNYKRRTAFTHPFAFFITFFSLNVLALVENGVYSMEVLVTYFFISHAITFMYAGILFFQHYHCADWEKENNKYVMKSRDGTMTTVDPNNIMAYFGIVMGVALLELLAMTPLFPTNPGINFMWFLPALYILITVGGAIYIEHLMDGQKDEENASGMVKLDLLAFKISMSQAVLILVVLIYFTGIHSMVKFGDTYFPNGGTLLNRPNYAAEMYYGKYVLP